MLIFDQLNKADRHLRMLSWVVAAGLVVLLAGLWWVQIIRSRHYVEDQRNQSYRTVRVPSPRGRILDRHGVALAENRPAYNVSLYLEDHVLRAAIQKEYRQQRGAALAAAAAAKRKVTQAELRGIGRASRYLVVSNVVAQLGAHLQQSLLINEQQFHQHYEQRLALPMTVLTNLDVAQVARLQERSLNLPGVDMEIQPTRTYPMGHRAAHVLGYLTRSEASADDELSFYNYRLPDYRGMSGIESSLEGSLRGKAGATMVRVNNLGFRESEMIESSVEAGHDVTLTIDSEIQKAAEQALQNAPGGRGTNTRGAAVVMDCRTGEILALVSSPVFDPNRFIPRIQPPVWTQYNDEELTPMLNRAIYGGYPPGSIFKIIVALAAYDAGVLNPTNIYRSEGRYLLGRRSIGDTAPAGDYDFKRAFIKSSNSYFIDHGLRAGPERILSLSQRFHLGERTGIPLGQDSRALLPTREWQAQNRRTWGPGDTANLSIGQGDLLVTPLQMAAAVAAVANGGKLLWPRLVNRIVGPDELLQADARAVPAPRIRDEIPVSRKALEIVRAAMLADVEDGEGTGTKARVEGFRVCGKTGTAQVMKGNRMDHYVVWFAAYAPFEDPRYSVIVMVDHGSSGGGTCAPVAGRIFTALQAWEQRMGAPRRDALASN